MANRKEEIKELTDRLEEGVREVFESGRYEEYLRVMSKFHHYSYRNILLYLKQFTPNLGLDSKKISIDLTTGAKYNECMVLS